MTSDLDLLGQYAHNRAQDAFTEIVRRHVDLVYSAALRQVRSPQLADEVAQSVFTDLARNAVPLCGMKPDTVLTAWLYQVTHRTAVDVVRKESRRQRREQIASEMNAMNAAEADWTHIEPLLDEAMHALDATDRAAVLLRYFENKSLREVGQTLGTSDDTAQKRVSRAVERLREFFSRHGVTVGASGLAVVLSANAVQAAPVGLAGTIATAGATLAGTTLSATATTTAVKIIVMTTLQKSIIAAFIAAAVGTGLYEARQYYHSHHLVEYIPRETWAAAGFATPEAAIRSFCWAKSQGDINTAMTMATPELWQEVENKYFKNKSDSERGKMLIETVKNVKGIGIQKRTVVADDQVVFRMLQLHSDGKDGKSYSIVTMKRIDGEWKISGVEEHPDGR
jgi:RNA polymerase sigma factor (sigma-70 family)